MTSKRAVDKTNYNSLDDDNYRSEDFYDTDDADSNRALLLVQEKGVTPVNILPHDSAVIQNDSSDTTCVVMTEKTAANGHTDRSMVLHIPGESGELAGSDYSDDSEENGQDMTETAEFYAKVRKWESQYQT